MSVLHSEFPRCQTLETTVREPILVIVPSPSIDLLPSASSSRFEPMSVQALLPESSVEENSTIALSVSTQNNDLARVEADNSFVETFNEPLIENRPENGATSLDAGGTSLWFLAG